MRMRKKKNLIPRMERCSDRLIREPQKMAGKWRELMPEAKELHLELGCGKGRFTAGTAAANPDVLLIAVEMVPDAMVVAMERCANEGLSNAFFVDANANLLPDFFAPGEVDRIYINFCDPWPSNRHAKRRLTHGNFLKLYRQVLKIGGEIHFKTDNRPLFEFSVEEIPQFGFTLSQVTRDLHANGPKGIMTDYEAKFHAQGVPINRLVATMVPWTESFPTDIRRLRERWLDTFAPDIPEELLGQHVLAEGNFLWNIFTWGQIPCETGAAATEALKQQDLSTCYLFYYEFPPASQSHIRSIQREDLANLLEDQNWYLADESFTWTYAHPCTQGVGPFFCKNSKK